VTSEPADSTGDDPRTRDEAAERREADGGRVAGPLRDAVDGLNRASG
jgi:hypothetical protein